MMHATLGALDFRWGNDAGGIQHILNTHSEAAVRRIPEIVAHGKVVAIGKSRAFIEHDGMRHVLMDNFHGMPSNRWVVSAYTKKEKGRAAMNSADFTIRPEPMQRGVARSHPALGAQQENISSLRDRVDAFLNLAEEAT